MRNRQNGKCETYHLTCPVCGALPGTSCLEDYRELERVHPSRRMSVAERNRRHATSGWEPPELAEQRLRERDADIADAPQPSPGAREEDRRPHVTRQELRPEPRRSVNGLIWAPGSPRVIAAGETVAGTASPDGDEDARAWFAAYLGRCPQDAEVPRWKLRNIASARWWDTADRPLPLSRSRQLQHLMPGRGGSSKGRRSSQKLAGHLRSFEELGLIRRDYARDAVIIADPIGLLRLAGVPVAPRPRRRHRRRRPLAARSRAGGLPRRPRMPVRCQLRAPT